jgi:hypothetical protein
MSSEFEVGKESIVAASRYCPGICLDGLRKTVKNFGQDSLFESGD